MKEDRQAVFFILFALIAGLTANYFGNEKHKVGITEEERAQPESKYYDEKMPQISSELENALNSIQDCKNALNFNDSQQLLSKSNSYFDNGVCTMDDGSIYVAVNTKMPDVTGEMLDFWFAWHSVKSIRYKLWHPLDHAYVQPHDFNITQDVNKTNKEKYVNNTHVVIEKLNDDSYHHIAINFLFPEECGFNAESYAANGVETVVCAQIYNEQKEVKIGKMIHLLRKTDTGNELVSRFWLANGIQVASLQETNIINKFLNSSFMKSIIVKLNGIDGKNLAVHCSKEMQKLASFLPDLYKEYGDSF